ncbi:AHH domain-containing protein, partial [Saccharibacillus kuerlensis]
YAYVNGNPVSYIDPFGLSADGATWWQTGLSFAADSLPFVGTFKGIQEVFTGVDMITGQQMSVTDRVATGVGTAASWIPFGKHVGKYVAKEGIEGGAWLVGKIKKPPVQTTEPRDFSLKLDLQLFAKGDREANLKKLGFQDHHIISDKNKLTKNHDLLDEVGYNLQSRNNKMFLPTNDSLHPTRSIHKGRHSNSVSENLANQMDEVLEYGRANGWTQQQYNDALRDIINGERKLLRDGSRALNKNKRPNAN